MKISGIYKIQSILKSSRIYIGSGVNIFHRWECHLSDLKLNKHSNKRLQNHYNKYGKSDFQFSILVGCDKEDLIKMEQYFIDSFNPYFNICKQAGSQFGFKHSDETKELQRNRKLGRKLSQEHKNKISNSMRNAMIGNKNGMGHKMTEMNKKKLLESKIGKHRSDETKRKISEAFAKKRILKMQLNHN